MKKLLIGAIKEVFATQSDEFQSARLAEIVERYSEPHRHYHTLTHICEMLEMAKKFDITDTAFLAAILYHDIVYEPGRYAPGYPGPSNEQDSADFCKEVLSAAQLDKTIIKRASDLIVMTQTHAAPEDDHEARLFMDIDMAIVGANPFRYEEYCYATTKEFLTVFTPEQYLAGRSHFLKHTKDQTPVFKTAYFEDREAPAMQNMTWELANLQTIVLRTSGQAARPANPGPL